MKGENGRVWESWWSKERTTWGEFKLSHLVFFFFSYLLVFTIFLFLNSNRMRFLFIFIGLLSNIYTIFFYSSPFFDYEKISYVHTNRVLISSQKKLTLLVKFMFSVSCVA